MVHPGSHSEVTEREGERMRKWGEMGGKREEKKGEKGEGRGGEGEEKKWIGVLPLLESRPGGV